MVEPFGVKAMNTKQTVVIMKLDTCAIKRYALGVDVTARGTVSARNEIAAVIRNTQLTLSAGMKTPLDNSYPPRSSKV